MEDLRTGLDLILSVIALSDVGQDDGTDESFTMNQSDQNISDVPTHYNSKGDSIKKQPNFLTGSGVARSTQQSH